ncbi:hypothetical protein MTO96_024013 [Rhipicephalus appendiculatus]
MRKFLYSRQHASKDFCDLETCQGCALSAPNPGVSAVFFFQRGRNEVLWCAYVYVCACMCSVLRAAEAGSVQLSPAGPIIDECARRERMRKRASCSAALSL